MFIFASCLMIVLRVSSRYFGSSGLGISLGKLSFGVLCILINFTGASRVLKRVLMAFIIGFVASFSELIISLSGVRFLILI